MSESTSQSSSSPSATHLALVITLALSISVFLGRPFLKKVTKLQSGVKVSKKKEELIKSILVKQQSIQISLESEISTGRKSVTPSRGRSRANSSTDPTAYLPLPNLSGAKGNVTDSRSRSRSTSGAVTPIHNGSGTDSEFKGKKKKGKQAGVTNLNVPSLNSTQTGAAPTSPRSTSRRPLTRDAGTSTLPPEIVETVEVGVQTDSSVSPKLISDFPIPDSTASLPNNIEVTLHSSTGTTCNAQIQTSPPLLSRKSSTSHLYNLHASFQSTPPSILRPASPPISPSSPAILLPFISASPTISTTSTSSPGTSANSRRKQTRKASGSNASPGNFVVGMPKPRTTEGDGAGLLSPNVSRSATLEVDHLSNSTPSKKENPVNSNSPSVTLTPLSINVNLAQRPLSYSHTGSNASASGSNSPYGNNYLRMTMTPPNSQPVPPSAGSTERSFADGARRSGSNGGDGSRNGKNVIRDEYQNAMNARTEKEGRNGGMEVIVDCDERRAREIGLGLASEHGRRRELSANGEDGIVRSIESIGINGINGIKGRNNERSSIESRNQSEGFASPTRPTISPWSPQSTPSTNPTSQEPTTPLTHHFSPSMASSSQSRPNSRQSSLSVPLNSLYERQQQQQQQQLREQQAFTYAHAQGLAQAQFQHAFSVSFQQQQSLANGYQNSQGWSPHLPPPSPHSNYNSNSQPNPSPQNPSFPIIYPSYYISHPSPLPGNYSQTLRSPTNSTRPKKSVNGVVNESTGWKVKLRTAEMENDRSGKELEIARWRLVVLEEDRLREEIVNQEALSALASRAQRAELKLKLLLGKDGESSSNVSTSVSASVSVVGSGSPEQGTSSFEGESEVKIHPLAWLDLDSITFSTSPAPTRPSFLSSPMAQRRSSSNRSVNRFFSSHSHQSISPSSSKDYDYSPTRSRRNPPSWNRRRSTGIGANTGAEEEEEEEILIVLDSPRGKFISRRNSDLGEEEVDSVGGNSTVLEQGDFGEEGIIGSLPSFLRSKKELELPEILLDRASSTESSIPSSALASPASPMKILEPIPVPLEDYSFFEVIGTRRCSSA